MALLKGWQAQLLKKPRLPEFLALQDSIRRYRIPIQLFKDLISAFSQDSKGPLLPGF